MHIQTLGNNIELQKISFQIRWFVVTSSRALNKWCKFSSRLSYFWRYVLGLWIYRNGFIFYSGKTDIFPKILVCLLAPDSNIVWLDQKSPLYKIQMLKASMGSSESHLSETNVEDFLWFVDPLDLTKELPLDIMKTTPTWWFRKPIHHFLSTKDAERDFLNTL